MLYHGFRFTFTGLDDGDRCITITSRRSPKVLGKVASIAAALDWVAEVERQTAIPYLRVVGGH